MLCAMLCKMFKTQTQIIKIMKKKYFAKSWLMGISLIFIIAVWSVLIEPNIIKIEKISLNIKNLPTSFDGAKIVHLSDLHSKNYGKTEKKVLKILNRLNPDFVFLTGDIVDWSTNDFKSCQVFWKELSKNFAGKVFAVYGNHEHKNSQFKTFNKLFRETKIEVLDNQSEKIYRGGDFIELVGIDDPYPGCKELGYGGFQKKCSDYLQKNYNNNLRAAVGEIENEKIPKILLSHSPEVFREVKKFNKKIDLVLTGHTHGGQINIPFFVNFILPLHYDQQYKKGLFKENSIYLYVNRGVGNSGLPIRFNSFPEIALIEIRSE